MVASTRGVNFEFVCASLVCARAGSAKAAHARMRARRARRARRGSFILMSLPRGENLFKSQANLSASRADARAERVAYGSASAARPAAHGVDEYDDGRGAEHGRQRPVYVPLRGGP